jgi:hypothetical protein
MKHAIAQSWFAAIFFFVRKMSRILGFVVSWLCADETSQEPRFCFVSNPLKQQDSGGHRDSLLPTCLYKQRASYAIRTYTAWTDSFFVWRRYIVWSVGLVRFSISHYIVERSHSLACFCSYHNGISLWKTRADDVNSRYEFTFHLFISQRHSILPNTVQKGAVAACFVSPQENGVKSDRASNVKLFSTKKVLRRCSISCINKTK